MSFDPMGGGIGWKAKLLLPRTAISLPGLGCPKPAWVMFRDMSGNHRGLGAGDVVDTAAQLAAVARELAAHRSVPETLDGIVAAAAAQIPGADVVGLSYLERGRVVARAATDAVIDALDEVQTRLAEGPCFDTLVERCQIARIEDFADDDRWPKFAAEAVERGLRSGLSLRVHFESRTLGVLTALSRRAHAISSEDEQVAGLFVSHAAVALVGVDRLAQMDTAVRHRDTIGQAKGYLMASHGLTEDEAFATLVRYSQQHGVKLYDVARDLVGALTKDSGGAG